MACNLDIDYFKLNLIWKKYTGLVQKNQNY